MNWVDQYKKIIVSLEEAVSVVKSGDRIFISGNAATPDVARQWTGTKEG